VTGPPGCWRLFDDVACARLGVEVVRRPTGGNGSVLLDRLDFDESAVLRGADTPLASSTVALRELGAPTETPIVAQALVEGFRQTLDIDFTVGVRGFEVTRWSSVEALP
jgi:lipoate-protein ligase A